MPYRLSALAEQDLEKIWAYLAEEASPATADRIIDAIFDRFELLGEQPRMGRNRPEFGEGVRSFVAESYVIYYRHDQALLIARVFMAFVIRLPHGPSDVRYSPPLLHSATKTSISSETL
jgi:toxin ParE1/3/4